MTEEEREELKELAIEVGTARSACLLIRYMTQILETEEPDDWTRQMELQEGLGFCMGAVAERLREIQAKLSRD
ncbi:MAG: hypothetical protein ACLQMF_05475 [Rectinemataceae bacterium]